MFYCHMLGHVNADYNKRNINLIFNKLMEMFKGYKYANKIRHENRINKKRIETQVGEYIGPWVPKYFKEFLMTKKIINLLKPF